VDERQTYRSPFAVLIWWLWVLFAVANLIDLAVQGRDHFSVVAAFILVLVTGVVYAAALRPRIVADDDGLSIVNPLRDHRVGWPAVAAVEATDLIRVRCEWPLGDREDTAPDADQDAVDQANRVIYSWAVHSSRRRQFAAQVRAERVRSRPRGTGGGSLFAAPATQDAPPTFGDVGPVVAALGARAKQAHEVGPGQQARPPVSTWYWPALAAIVIPALALVVAVLALPGQLTFTAGRRVARPGPQPVHVVGGRARLDRRVHEDGHVPRGGQASLVAVEHVQPGEHVPIERLHPDLELRVVAEGNPVPVVELFLVDLWHVVEHDEYALGGILDNRGERTVPADVLTAERQTPAFQPPCAPLRGMRAAFQHLRRIHVAAIGGV
jgi:Bacterial PH domain